MGLRQYLYGPLATNSVGGSKGAGVPCPDQTKSPTQTRPSAPPSTIAIVPGTIVHEAREIRNTESMRRTAAARMLQPVKKTAIKRSDRTAAHHIPARWAEERSTRHLSGARSGAEDYTLRIIKPELQSHTNAIGGL